MPTITIPLVGPFTRRGYPYNGSATIDQQYRACTFSLAKNSTLGESMVWAEKRQGLTLAGLTPAAGVKGSFVFASQSRGVLVSGFGATTTTVYWNTTACGVIPSRVYHAIETVINGITYVLMVDETNSTGWFLPHDATSGFTFTGDTHTNTTIDNVSSLTGLYVGQLISGTGIAAATRIASITAPSTITTTLATTATNAGVTITREGIAKIIDADFPTNIVGAFAEMNGYIFIMTADAKIYNSDLNSVTSWSASNFITCDTFSDKGKSAFRYKNNILGFGAESIEFLWNTGNSSGSPLSINRERAVNGIGLYNGGNGICITILSDQLFFIANNDHSLYSLSGGSPRKLSDIGTPLGTSIYPYRLATALFSSELYVLVICTVDGAIDQTYFYHPISGNFSLANFPFVPSATLDANAVYYVNTSGADGIIYCNVNTSIVYQDNTVAFTMTIQTEPKVLNNGKGFIINSVELLADNQSSGSTQLEISRDDYTTFQVLGNFGLTSRRKRITRGGLCRNHAIFRLTDSGNQAWRGQALVVNWTPCAT